MVTQRDFAGAAEEFGASQEIRRQLSDREPQNATYRSELFYADFQLGLARYQQHDLPAALTALTAAEALGEQLKEGISAGEMSRLQQALRITRSEIAAPDSSNASPPGGAAKPQQ